jgi:hypothetical protein
MIPKLSRWARPRKIKERAVQKIEALFNVEAKQRIQPGASEEFGDNARIPDRDRQSIRRPIRRHARVIPQRNAEVQRKARVKGLDKPPEGRKPGGISRISHE